MYINKEVDDVSIDVDDYVDEVKEHYDLIERTKHPVLNELLEILEKRGDYELIKEVRMKLDHGYSHRLEDLIR